MTLTRRIYGLLAGLLLAGSAVAAPHGTLVFTEPTGIVGPADSIPVWVRLTLDADSAPLQLDFSNLGANVDPADYPTWDKLTDVYVNTYFACSGTFTTVCSEPPYRFDFNYDTKTGSMIGVRDITIQPGESRDYLFGTFVPAPVPVAEGTYEFYGSGLTLNFAGGYYARDDFGNLLLDQDNLPYILEQEFRSIDIAATCPPTGGPCSFSRTVVAAPVPVPAAVWLLGSAVGGLMVSRRHRA